MLVLTLNFLALGYLCCNPAVAKADLCICFCVYLIKIVPLQNMSCFTVNLKKISEGSTAKIVLIMKV